MKTRGRPSAALLLVLALAACAIRSSDASTPSTAAEAEIPISDVVTLTDANFDELTSSGAWMIEFYAPWCGHCKRLSPIWDAAASRLKGKVNFAKIDGTVHKNTAQRFSVRGYPTIKFIRDGEYEFAKGYKGGRTVEKFEEYCLKMLGPPTQYVDAQTFSAARAASPVAFILLPQKPGSTAEDAFSAVARQWQDTHAFLISDDPALSKKLHAGALPAVLVLRDTGAPEPFEGPLTKEALAQWVKENRHPLVAELDDYNWAELTTELGKVTVIAVTNPDDRGTTAGYLEKLRGVAAKWRGQFTFAFMNGMKWKEYVGTYGIEADKGTLPQLLALDMARDRFSHRPDLRSPEEMEALLEDLAAGRAEMRRRPPQDFNQRLEYMAIDIKEFTLAWWPLLLAAFIGLNFLAVYMCFFRPSAPSPAEEPKKGDKEH